MRKFLKDLAEKNILLDFQEENTDEFLELYLDIALSYLNNFPPPVANYSFQQFPNAALLLHRSAWETMMSNNIVKARNDLTYNDGGITVNDGPKYKEILRMLEAILRTEEENWKKYLVSVNIAQGWGGVSSPYANLYSLSYTNVKTFLSVGY